MQICWNAIPVTTDQQTSHAAGMDGWGLAVLET